MTPQEQEFNNALVSVGHDAQLLVMHLYQEQTIHFLVGTDPDVRDALNQYAGFFLSVLAGHQTATFAALHRLYETEADHESLGSLLRYAQRHLGMFTRVALSRRRREAGMRAEVAEQFVANAFEPDGAAFQGIRTALRDMRDLYARRARDIRHAVFAHTGRAPLAERAQLFDGVMLRDLERMAVFPLVMHRAFERLFNDGYTPDITMPTTNIADVVNNEPPAGQGHFLHFQVARHVRDFLRDYTRMMQREDEQPA